MASHDQGLDQTAVRQHIGRRRGTQLSAAIYRATLDELAEKSFEELGFDKIAARAGAGKASLYRRWRGPAELVLDALTNPLTGFGDAVLPDSGSLRLDLLDVLTDFAKVLDQPRGRALRPLMTQRQRHPELFEEVFRKVAEPIYGMLLHVLERGAARGEVRAAAVTPRIAALGPQLVIVGHMQLGPLPQNEIDAIVDEVLMPLVTDERSQTKSAQSDGCQLGRV